MIVKLIAHTVLTTWAFEVMQAVGYEPHDEAEDADELAEFSGRLCYQSWSRPNPATATNQGYLKNILDQEHYSVLEHASASFYISGVSRSLTHELVRHRHLSFSQLSQRYVDESEAKIILPPAIATYDPDLVMSKIAGNVMLGAQEAYAQLVHRLGELGLSRKEARQAARSVLPNATETQLVVSGNLHAWRDVIEKRTKLNPDTGKPFADLEIYHLMVEIRRQLNDLAPNTFQDLMPKES